MTKGEPRSLSCLCYLHLRNASVSMTQGETLKQLTAPKYCNDRGTEGGSDQGVSGRIKEQRIYCCLIFLESAISQDKEWASNWMPDAIITLSDILHSEEGCTRH